MKDCVELARIESSNPRCDLCLEYGDTDEGPRFRIVWRGGDRSLNQYHNRPAYFTWEMLGELIGAGVRTKYIERDHIAKFFSGFYSKVLP